MDVAHFIPKTSKENIKKKQPIYKLVQEEELEDLRKDVVCRTICC